MYPASAFALFSPFPRDPTVFVAMSFDSIFRPRWERVIKPAIEDAGLEPDIVNAGLGSEAILTQILLKISSCTLVFADVTEVGGSRNGNVLYELGLAHAVRQPQEVVIFRSDSKPLLFDIVQVRVHTYDPENAPDDARKRLAATLRDAVAAVEIERSATVARTADSLDATCVDLLFRAFASDSRIDVPRIRSVADTVRRGRLVGSIARLLELGLLRTVTRPVSREELDDDSEASVAALMQYEMTPFGRAVILNFGGRMLDALPAGMRAEFLAEIPALRPGDRGS